MLFEKQDQTVSDLTFVFGSLQGLDTAVRVSGLK